MRVLWEEIECLADYMDEYQSNIRTCYPIFLSLVAVQRGAFDAFGNAQNAEKVANVSPLTIQEGYHWPSFMPLLDMYPYLCFAHNSLAPA